MVVSKRMTSSRGKSFRACTTCRIRRVKCDETRPACLRCTSTGRKCDGYAEQLNFRASPYSALMLYHKRNHDEIQAFQYFVQDVAPGMSRIIDPTWWHQLIPQASYQDAVVWYAVTAMARLMMHVQASAQDRADLFTISVTKHKSRDTAVRWYNKSVIALRTQLQGNSVWTATHSISAIVYMCIEALLGNEQGAFEIYMRADSILQQTKYKRRQLDVLYDDSHVHHATIRMLRHAAAGNGVFYPEHRLVSASQKYSFSSWEEASDELHYFLGECHNFIVSVLESKIGRDKFWQPSDQVLCQRDAFLSRLENLRTAIIGLAASSKALHAQETAAVMILVYGQFGTWLHQCTSQFETVFDRYFDTFQEMVEAAATLIDGFTDGKRPVYSFEARLGAGLWFAAMRCRHPCIRRHALRLLRRGPIFESMRNHVFSIEMAEKAIAIEESGDENGTFDEIAHSTRVPPEEDRICWQKDRQVLEAGSIVRLFPYGKWQKDEEGQWYVHDYCAVLGPKTLPQRSVSPT